MAVPSKGEELPVPNAHQPFAMSLGLIFGKVFLIRFVLVFVEFFLGPLPLLRGRRVSWSSDIGKSVSRRDSCVGYHVREGPLG